MANFGQNGVVLGKRFVSCALTVVYSTVGRSIAYIYVLGGIFNIIQVHRVPCSLEQLFHPSTIAIKSVCMYIDIITP